jgi:hypothetical protein
MKIRDVHERMVAAPPERIAALVADFDAIWPTRITPAPRPLKPGHYQAGFMVWEEVDRPGAIRAFRVISPEGFQGEHWFELESSEGGTLLRLTVDGEAFGKYEAIWRERIEPLHALILQGILDNVERAVA